MKSFIFLLFVFVLNQSSIAASPSRPQAKREFYQLTVYHFKDETQGQVIENYLKEALIPALHRAGASKIGVFSSLANDTALDKTIYVLLPLSELEFVTKIQSKLSADASYQSAGGTYLNTIYTNPPYTRMETILLQAFAMAPKMQVPGLTGAKKDRVYELRSYESATEKIFRNKVQMFNEGDEIGLFKKLGFNAVFYGEVMAGSKMPNLMYMTSFENMAERDAHWKAFVDDPYWKKLSSMPEYQHNVSHIDIIFLRPTEYSDI